jgi:hypothetical protein
MVAFVPPIHEELEDPYSRPSPSDNQGKSQSFQFKTTAANKDNIQDHHLKTTPQNHPSHATNVAYWGRPKHRNQQHLAMAACKKLRDLLKVASTMSTRPFCQRTRLAQIERGTSRNIGICGFERTHQ